MNRIFRRIREKLLGEGHVRGYLLYATGEVFLVVIGILIALQVNNWNEERKLRGEEQRYVNELINDMEEDSIALKALLDEAYIIGRSKVVLVNYLDDPSRVPDSLIQHHHNQWMSVQKFTPITTTVDEIKSGSGLGVIADDELRRSIVSLYNNYEQWEVDDDVFQKSLDIFFQLSRKHLKNVNDPTEEEIIALLKMREVANVIRTNYANSRAEAIEVLLAHNQNILASLGTYQKEIAR